jgi:hypothetical protein
MTLSTNGIRGNAQDKKKISNKYSHASLFDEIDILKPVNLNFTNGTRFLKYTSNSLDVNLRF